MFCLLLGNLLMWVAVVVDYLILEEVNRAAPSENQIRWIFSGWRLFEILALHRGLYPHSRKRSWMGWCAFGAAALTLIGAVIWDRSSISGK
jgi:hypothetical protein